MPLSAQQIVALSCQIAKCPGFTQQAGQWLNSLLSDLAQTYDFEINCKTFGFTFDTSTVYQNNIAGAGPNLMPTDFLRAKDREIIFYIQGVRYVLIILDQGQYDALVQTAGWTSYPQLGYIDLNLASPFAGRAGLMVWPPASGAYTTQIRYYSQPADISQPETSATVPWFPNQNYLITRLAGELMKVTNDDRAKEFLGDTPEGAEGILRKFLKMKDDPEGSVDTVKLDRRRFGRSFYNLPNTKIVGW